MHLLQVCQDVEDEDTLKAVEAAVRESTSIKRIDIDYRQLKWTNVATALLKGAAENMSLRVLVLRTPLHSPPPQDVVNEVKQKRKRLVLGINITRSVSSPPVHHLSVVCPYYPNLTNLSPC